MQSLTDQTARQAIAARLGRISPDSAPLWGSLTVPRMLCHLGDQLRVAVGDLPARRTDSWASRTLLKWLVVQTPMRPPPGKAQTAPEMLTSLPSTWEEDVQHVLQLMERVAAGPTAEAHPYFGPLTHEEWTRLAWKHLDHHLRQFGG